MERLRGISDHNDLYTRGLTARVNVWNKWPLYINNVSPVWSQEHEHVSYNVRLRGQHSQQVNYRNMSHLVVIFHFHKDWKLNEVETHCIYFVLISFWKQIQSNSLKRLFYSFPRITICSRWLSGRAFASHAGDRGSIPAAV